MPRIRADATHTSSANAAFQALPMQLLSAFRALPNFLSAHGVLPRVAQQHAGHRRGCGSTRHCAHNSGRAHRHSARICALCECAQSAYLVSMRGSLLSALRALLCGQCRQCQRPAQKPKPAHLNTRTDTRINGRRVVALISKRGNAYNAFNEQDYIARLTLERTYPPSIRAPSPRAV